MYLLRGLKTRVTEFLWLPITLTTECSGSSRTWYPQERFLSVAPFPVLVQVVAVPLQPNIRGSGGGPVKARRGLAVPCGIEISPQPGYYGRHWALAQSQTQYCEDTVRKLEYLQETHTNTIRTNLCGLGNQTHNWDRPVEVHSATPINNRNHSPFIPLTHPNVVTSLIGIW